MVGIQSGLGLLYVVRMINVLRGNAEQRVWSYTMGIESSRFVRWKS